MPSCPAMASSVVSPGRPTQLGGEAHPAFPPARDLTATVAVHNAHESPPPRPTSERPESTCDVTATGNCTLCTVRNSIRKYPMHFCAWKRCCYKFSGEGGLLGKNFEHLPVCHSWCWSLERDRLERNAKQAGEWPEAMNGLPMCHRQCYMQVLAKIQDPDAPEREVVPRNRTLSERLRVPKLEHKLEGWFKCLTMPPSDRGRESGSSSSSPGEESRNGV